MIDRADTASTVDRDGIACVRQPAADPDTGVADRDPIGRREVHLSRHRTALLAVAVALGLVSLWLALVGGGPGPEPSREPDPAPAREQARTPRSEPAPGRVGAPAPEAQPPSGEVDQAQAPPPSEPEPEEASGVIRRVWPIVDDGPRPDLTPTV